jgi:hypothetical protein
MTKRSIDQVYTAEDAQDYCAQEVNKDLKEPRQKRNKLKQEYQILNEEKSKIQEQLDKINESIEETNETIKQSKSKYTHILQVKYLLECIEQLNQGQALIVPSELFPSLVTILVDGLSNHTDSDNGNMETTTSSDGDYKHVQVHLDVHNHIKSLLDKHEIYLGNVELKYHFISNPASLSIDACRDGNYNMELKTLNEYNPEIIIQNGKSLYPRLYMQEDDKHVKIIPSRQYIKWFDKHVDSWDVIEHETDGDHKGLYIEGHYLVNEEVLLIGKKPKNSQEEKDQTRQEEEEEESQQA